MTAEAGRPGLDAAKLYELLPLLADGFTYQQMAPRLFLGVEGVRDRAKRLYRHLNAENAAQPVAIAYRRGLLRVDDPERHTETCAARTPPPVCDCGADHPVQQIGAA